MDALNIGMITEARDAREKLILIEKKAIERARLVLEMNGAPVKTFKNEDGFRVKLVWHSFSEPDATTDLIFECCDEQSGGSNRLVRVPREPMMEDTEELREFIEFKRLQAKFG